MEEMTSHDAAQLCRLFDAAGIKVWIDGGWAVDALMGSQTRAHEDLDIVIQEEDLFQLRDLLSAHGYHDVERDDTRDWNFVLGDDRGHLVDVHVIVFTKDAIPMYGPAATAATYQDLTGSGKIDGYPVKCTTPESLVAHRTGYQLRERDYHDVLAICNHFGLEYPSELVKIRPG